MTHKISIKNGNAYERTALTALARVKGLTVENSPGDSTRPLEIRTRYMTVRGFTPCVLYLENKYPYPSLLFGEPESQAAMLMVLDDLNQVTPGNTTPLADLIEQANEARPFLLGPQMSLIDIAAAPYRQLMPAPYRDTLIATLGGT